MRRFHKILSVMLVVAFANAASGFSITSHFCSESGKEYFYTSLNPESCCSRIEQNAPHAGEIEAMETAADGCCADSGPVAPCNDPHDHANDVKENCCNDQSSFIKIDELIKNNYWLAFTAAFVPRQVQLFSTSSGEAQAEGFASRVFDAFIPGPLVSPPFLCVFRI